MPKIDKQLALELMLTGQRDSEIAAHFGTSRQAVNLVRKQLVKQGTLEHHRFETPIKAEVNRPSATLNPTHHEPPPQRSEKDSMNSGDIHPTYDEITAWIVRAVSEASESKRLRRELQVTQSDLARLQAENEQLRNDLRMARNAQAASLTRAQEYEQAIRALRRLDA